MIKTRTIRIRERFCDLCGLQIDKHFGTKLPDRCEMCGDEICPKCQGTYKIAVSKFKGNSGTTFEIPELCKFLCLTCGTKFEKTFIKELKKFMAIFKLKSSEGE